MSTAELSPVQHSAQLDRSEILYEVIDGQIVELPPMGSLQEFMANFLHIKLGGFVLEQKLGHGLMEVLFDMTDLVGRKRRPDVAFLSAERWPLSKPIPETDGIKAVPNLAVEIVSPSNTWEEVREKTKEYFRAGVERVWVISAAQREVHLYDGPISVRVLVEENELTDDMLPGFRLPIGELFEMAGPPER